MNEVNNEKINQINDKHQQEISANKQILEKMAKDNTVLLEEHKAKIDELTLSHQKEIKQITADLLKANSLINGLRNRQKNISTCNSVITLGLNTISNKHAITNEQHSQIITKMKEEHAIELKKCAAQMKETSKKSKQEVAEIAKDNYKMKTEVSNSIQIQKSLETTISELKVLYNMLYT